MVVEARGKLVRVEVEGMSVYSSGPEVTFSIWGTRFRKDGLPGKRTEEFWIVVENDLEREQQSLVRDLDLGGGKVKKVRESWQSVTISSGAVTFDLSQANNFNVTLNANITSITFSNIPATGNGTPIVIELTQDATGGRTVAGWPAAVKWPGGSAPTVTAAANAVDVIAGYVRDATNIRLGLSMADSK